MWSTQSVAREEVQGAVASAELWRVVPTPDGALAPAALRAAGLLAFVLHLGAQLARHAGMEDTVAAAGAAVVDELLAGVTQALRHGVGMTYG